MHDSVKVILNPLGETIQVNRGTPMVDLLHRYGVEFPCGGNGICGRCRVKILRGDLGMSGDHDRLAQNLNLKKNERLACKCFVNQDVNIEIGQYETIILADQSEFDFKPQTGYGVAIDLGTTTIIGQLIDLKNGQICNSKSILNSQSRYGADIMSRIDFAINKEGYNQLHESVRKDILDLIFNLTKDLEKGCTRIVIVGNNVMQHIFCNFDLTGLSAFPFESTKHIFIEYTSQQLGIQHLPDCKIEFYPAIGSFIGSDILAGIVSVGMHQNSEKSILVDLGTNGEICVGNKDRILCASTAAGPAFEGTNISMGMTASTGAISSLYLEDEVIKSHTIGNVSPQGICGSGLIDAVALYHKTGIVDSTGQIVAKQDKIALNKNIFLTQKDIYEFLLAKAAIASGIEILCKELDIKKEQIDVAYIAGAFGNFINLENAVNVGLLQLPVEKIIRIGNTALIGAKMALFQDREEWKSILYKCQHVSLESFPNFQDTFASKMFLS